MKKKKQKLKPFFIDNRGKMINLSEINPKILSILLITTKKDQIRANHYHKNDEHYSYLLYGEMEYFYKGKNENKLNKTIVKKGEIVYTPKGEIHAMRFTQDSAFLALSTQKRDRDTYESDTIKIKII